MSNIPTRPPFSKSYLQQNLIPQNEENCSKGPGRIKSSKRKDLESAISLLISRNNKARKNLVQNLKLTAPKEELLLKTVHLKKSEHSFLSALFQKISWKTKIVSFDENKIYPALKSLEKDSDLAPSTLSVAKKNLKEKGLITWKNRYSKSTSKAFLKSTSNLYEMTTRVFDLALFTEFSLQRERSQKDLEKITALALKLLAPVKTEKTLHQLSGELGYLKKKKNETNLKTLEKIKDFWQENQTKDQEDCFKELENLVKKMGEKEKTSLFSQTKKKRKKNQKPSLARRPRWFKS